jgi:hypothetical protein
MKNKLSRNVNRRPKQNLGRAVRAVLTSTAEIKNFIYQQGNTAATTAGVVLPVTQSIIEGNEINQRSGRQIKLVSSDLRIVSSITTGTQVSGIRFMLFLDRMSLGVLPTVADVLEAATTISPLAITAHQANRYKILYDKAFPLVFSGADQQLFKHMMIKAKDKIEFLLPNNAVGANFKNAMYMLVIADSAGVGGPTYNFNVGVRYLDL